jgi:hypothetical protein
VFKDAIAKGMIEEGRWEKFALDPQNGFKVDHWTEFITEKELVELHRYAYKSFYFRPKYILNSIFETRSFHEFKSKSKGVLKLLNV